MDGAGLTDVLVPKLYLGTFPVSAKFHFALTYL